MSDSMDSGDSSSPPQGEVEGVRFRHGQQMKQIRASVGVRPPEMEGDEPARPSTFGGLWYEPNEDGGRIVLAVTERSSVDIDQLHEIVAPDDLRIIEVTHSYDEVRAIRHEILERCHAAAITVDAPIDPSPEGWVIHVVTSAGPDQLPDLADLPQHLLRVSTDAAVSRPRR